MILAFLPSPAQGVWHLGPLPIRAYALCIIAGVVVCVWMSERRWAARGGRAGTISDVAVWAIPFGVVGARIYHVITDPQLYFGAGRDPVSALYIWNGGLGIWGAVALGALGAYIGCRRHGVSLLAFGDAIAPGILVAQAIGRFGNWFNQELYGRPTDLPWALEIDPQNRLAGFEQFATFHPTFLYEALWNLVAAAAIVWLDRRLRLGGGRVFALYVAFYTVGRGLIENLRIDAANEFGPFRLNVWTSLVLFVLAVAYLFWSGRRGVTREDQVQLPAADPDRSDGASADDADDSDDSDDSDDDSDDELATRPQDSQSADDDARPTA
jgi:prolipoprotein diacylglyceryl transferase